uniref:Ovule protein n=1 Tax=Heterorhabditis bacteriophora TaxID=37862 RepID=A0A1I7WEZ3_HETBA
MLSCLHYVLESFTEARSTSEASEAVTHGQFLDSNRPISTNFNPWNYEVLPGNMFVDQGNRNESWSSSSSSIYSSYGCHIPTCVYILNIFRLSFSATINMLYFNLLYATKCIEFYY